MLHLLIPLLLLMSLVNASCYDPIGTETNERRNVTNTYVACNEGQNHTMCCRSQTDTCRSDGLCSNKGQLWRESCTDKTWNSPGCLKLCNSGTAKVFTSANGADMSKIDVMVTTCSDGSLCCGDPDSDSAISCCQSGKGVWILNNQVVSTKPSSTLSTTALSTPGVTPVTSVISSAISPAGTSTSSSSSGSKTNTGVIIGAVVGSITGLILVCAAILLLLRRRKASPKVEESKSLSPSPSPGPYNAGETPRAEKVVYAYKAELPDTPVAEMAGYEMKAEPRELPGYGEKLEPRELPA